MEFKVTEFEEPNGYFGSKRHVRDEMIRDNGHMADGIAKDIGFWFYVSHRIYSNFRTLWWRLIRYFGYVP